MSDPVQHLIIHGKTLEGQRFRPSDWAERLAGVLSHFRPAGSVASTRTRVSFEAGMSNPE